MISIKEILETILEINTKTIAKFFFEIGKEFEKLTNEYEKLKEEKKPLSEKMKSKLSASDWESKYNKLWKMHQDLLREFKK